MTSSEHAPNGLSQSAERVRHYMGRRLLTDDEILLLLCDEISRTYTDAERGYHSHDKSLSNQDDSCRT